LIDDLMGEDAVKADRAIEGLWGDGEPPKADAPIVVKAIMRHLTPQAGATDVGLMTKLVEVSKVSNSPDATAAMARLASSRPNGRVQQLAIQKLEDVKNENERSLFGTSPDSEIAQHDSDAVDALAGLARSADPEQRKLALNLLGMHPNNPVTKQVLRVGLNDRDSEVSAIAEKVLNHIIQRRPAQAASATTQPLP
jgi:hypothetical protein